LMLRVDLACWKAVVRMVLSIFVPGTRSTVELKEMFDVLAWRSQHVGS